MSPLQEIPAAEVEGALRAVLARPEFQERERTALERLIEWIGALFERLPLPEGLSEGLGWVLLWALVATVAGLLALSLARLLRRPRPAGGAPEQAGARAAERALELRAQAERARAAGDRLLALRLYFFALVVGLGRRGDLEYRDAWTNRELLARGHPAPEVERELGPLVSELDHQLFGGGQTSEGDLDRLAALCDRWLAAPSGGEGAP